MSTEENNVETTNEIVNIKDETNVVDLELEFDDTLIGLVCDIIKFKHLDGLSYASASLFKRDQIKNADDLMQMLGKVLVNEIILIAIMEAVYKHESDEKAEETQNKNN